MWTGSVQPLNLIIYHFANNKTIIKIGTMHFLISRLVSGTEHCNSCYAVSKVTKRP